MHNIDFDPITHRVSMSLETFLAVIRDAGKPSAPADAKPAVACTNCGAYVMDAGEHVNSRGYMCPRRTR